MASAKPRALISVFDKKGLVDLGKASRKRACLFAVSSVDAPRARPWRHQQGLLALGYELVSTGGSATALAAAGVPVKQVEVRPRCAQYMAL
jgi:AICAR transformylase/IMP cyclohydrolase PurH